MKVYIPTDIPLPSDKNFLDEIRDFLVGIIKMSKGNTFILFTSYSTKKKKKCQRDSHQAGTQINLAEFILIKNFFYLIISFGIAKRRR